MPYSNYNFEVGCRILGPWVRLSSFSPTSGLVNRGCKVYEDRDPKGAEVFHCGRVLQGELDNGYLVEALNAISTRPVLVRQLFYCHDVDKSIYIMRYFLNGTWVRVEIDDYVPLGDKVPVICCRSEHFPRILWPSLVEKGYAKANTSRPPFRASGGWQSLGGGGRVEEALADLTGGVSGRFSTRDVSPDRLFVYFYNRQRDTIFVARPDNTTCRKHAVSLSCCFPYAVSRAAHHEGRCYVQIFMGVLDGHCGVNGLDFATVPDSIWNAFPGAHAAGFTWLHIYDFHFYFNTIFECRLVNSPDVGLPGMPPPRHPNAAFAAGQAENVGTRSGVENAPIFFETVWSNAGHISSHNAPEFDISVPERHPCEVIACLSQMNNRVTQLCATRAEFVPLLLKVYQKLENNAYSKDMVCRSNWLPVRDAMVAFNCKRGGSYKIICEFPNEPGLIIDKLVFRCYTDQPGCTVTAAKAARKHLLVRADVPALAKKWTFVGCASRHRVVNDNEPEPLADVSKDSMQRLDGKHPKRCAVM